ncbi:hypothetical protein NDU88_000713 [Pleurodeles waltl]|uniref:Uncharacterized protein n=1 Tax=Pleurodeles waltl TaxID=8319 RepID=A0AAV7VUB6_PLEWA|nr:hypothetical protein NDU88_000713 [Pleurodeles waltl]
MPLAPRGKRESGALTTRSGGQERSGRGPPAWGPGQLTLRAPVCGPSETPLGHLKIRQHKRDTRVKPLTTGDRDHSPDNLCSDRKGKNKQNKSSRLSSLSPLEILKERQKAMEAAASLSGSDHGSPKQSQDDLEHSESEQESEFSHTSDKQGPDVTPGTSDNII